MSRKYNLQNALRLIKNPESFFGQLERTGLKLNRKIQNISKKSYGSDFMKKDWDNLIILDGCRYDTFNSIEWGDGKIKEVVSKGSGSKEFINKNFVGGEFYDTVYISANPHIHLISDKGIFHDVINAFEDGWDSELGTVPPNRMTKIVLDSAKAYPNKRIIAHYMQPHYPFIGETGREIEHESLIDVSEQDHGVDRLSIWTKLQFRLGGIEPSTVERAYEENLELVKPYICDLTEELYGKTVVTSDHGNLLGENGHPIPVSLYGHPNNIYHKKLNVVPWFEPPAGKRKSIQSDPPSSNSHQIDSEMVRSRLSDLGYV